MLPALIGVLLCGLGFGSFLAGISSRFGKTGLWIYDIETGTKEIVDDELHLLGNPVYNADNNVILITCDDPLNYGSNEYIVGGLYYPESNDFVYWKSYAKRMNIPFDITKQEWFEASVTHTYWN